MHLRAKSLLLLAVGLLLAAGAAVQSGCFAVVVGAAAGAGTVAYVRSDLVVTLDQNFAPVAQAADRAVDQLHFVRLSHAQDALTALWVARLADDRKVEIRLTATSARVTEVRIRVGLFGDQAVSMIILNTLKSDL